MNDNVFFQNLGTVEELALHLAATESSRNMVFARRKYCLHDQQRTDFLFSFFFAYIVAFHFILKSHSLGSVLTGEEKSTIETI